MGYKEKYWIRKAHRYLGLFIGLQFLLWTVSGLYFSWTNLDDIHGDPFKRDIPSVAFDSLMLGSSSFFSEKIHSLELVEILETPYYWINQTRLINANTGVVKNGITKNEALKISERHIVSGMKPKKVTLIETTDNHHEIRGKKLPLFAVEFEGDQRVVAYVSQKNGQFISVRHDAWRVFDFLWMTHTMDYQTRDDFNTLLLRLFSLFAVITVMSGFLLWFSSSSSLKNLKKRLLKKG